MTKQPNKKTIGAFILAGIIGLVVVWGLLLGFQWRGQHKDMYVLYFHESIKGLSVGAPVVLNGVEVGKVAKIQIVPDVETYEFNIPVYITFNNIEKTMAGMPERHQWSERKLVAALVERGLHGRLINQNLLTGQLMIELDVKPSKSIMTKGNNADDDMYEIPTTLSSLTELSTNVQNIPFREVADNLNKTLGELSAVLEPAAKISREVSRQSTETLENFNKAVTEVGRAAESLRNLADYLEQHPESLIRGRKKEKSRSKD